MEGVLSRPRIDYILYHLRYQVDLSDEIISSFRFVPFQGASMKVEPGTIVFPLSDAGAVDPEPVRIENIPVLFSLSASSDLFRWESGSLVFNHDFLKSAFYLLSGYQELVAKKRDMFGRFPFSDSIQKTLDIARKPLVNYYFSFIEEGIRDFCRKNNLPSKKRHLFRDFGFMLTHDVDIIDTYTLRNTLFRLKRLLLRKLSRNTFREDVSYFLEYFKQLMKLSGRNNPHWDFDYLLGAAHKRGFTSVFFFLHRDLKIDSRYTFDQSRMKKLFHFLNDRGCEIGLHGSIRSASEQEIMQKHKQSLEKNSNAEVSGVRQHMLVHLNNETTRIQESAGFRYDATMGFAEHEGFRHAFCHPFRLYDFEAERMTGIWHIPLVMMDATLYFYRKLGMSETMGSLGLLIDECRKFNGVFSLLWHNGNFDRENYPDGKKVFEGILDALHKQNAQSVSGIQCIEECERILN